MDGLQFNRNHTTPEWAAVLAAARLLPLLPQQVAVLATGLTQH